MKRKIHIAVYGSGLGHASRMSWVAKELVNNGDTVFFSSFDYAVDYLRKMGFQCEQVPPLDLNWKDEGVSAKKTMEDFPTLFSIFVQQIKKEREIIKKFKPDIVVSDTRLSAVAAAYFQKIPSITVTNQIRILLPPKFQTRNLTKIEGIEAEIFGFLWSRSKLILVPDIPSPYTISEANTGGIITANRKVKYVGFISPINKVGEELLNKVSKKLEFGKEKRVVFAQISGPPKTKKRMIEKITETSNMLSDKFIFVISKGKVGGEIEPKRIKGGWIYEWCPIKDELFALSDLLVIRGGHATISQSVLYGKPVISIPIINHSEQMSNATRIEEIGFGRLLDPDTLSSEKISSTVKEVNDNPSFKIKALELKRVAQNMNGVKNIVKIINSSI